MSFWIEGTRSSHISKWEKQHIYNDYAAGGLPSSSWVTNLIPKNSQKNYNQFDKEASPFYVLSHAKVNNAYFYQFLIKKIKILKSVLLNRCKKIVHETTVYKDNLTKVFIHYLFIDSQFLVLISIWDSILQSI